MNFHITLIWLLSQVTAGNVDYKSIGKIIFGSCNEVQEFGLWSLMSSFPFDKLILLGDNMYADTQVSDLDHKPATVNELKDQYEKLFSDPDYKKVISQLGGLEHVFAVYDDHDYGADNADKTYVHKNQSLNLFNEYFRSKNVNSKTPLDGVYASFSFNLKNLNIKVVLLDTRFNKSPKSEWETGDFLGENQWVWLENELNDIVPDVIILGSSIQVLPDDKLLEEYWGKFPLARERLFHLVLNSPNNNIFLISGDVHYAEFSQVGITFKNAFN
jgi:alkaline phosphatase D